MLKVLEQGIWLVVEEVEQQLSRQRIGRQRGGWSLIGGSHWRGPLSFCPALQGMKRTSEASDGA